MLVLGGGENGRTGQSKRGGVLFLVVQRKEDDVWTSPVDDNYQLWTGHLCVCVCALVCLATLYGIYTLSG